MKKIRLNSGNYTTVNDEDHAFLMQWKWGENGNGYAFRQERTGDYKENKFKTFFIHRIVNGTPLGRITDHINGNRLDNRRKNLRTVTAKQNTQNRKGVSKSSSKYKGVCLFKRDGTWVARIRIEGTLKHLGVFKDEDSAAKAYDKAAKKIHGKYARLNFPS